MDNITRKTWTVDDTYERLLRPNIHDMVALHDAWRVSLDYDYPTTQNIVFVNSHNWDWIAFLKAKRAAGYTV